ncbi:co-chaperone GroES [Puniceicoccus vermicola]|uniref:Co-chaperonin GroES n=1 Tax=Puniceicoccus vermicola TaxID=388746 RepID=A0A7X1AWU0_9BACT|nr:co-chaperone GroES [Puniceicoccus vermicola]MBC2601463.1 co-chaperone GroES [Puniceicoccus vermicola]
MSTATKSKKTATIRPLGDRVLLRRIEETESVRGGIYIPDSAREKPQEAEVIALGTGKTNDKGERIAFEVKAGDRVLLSTYGGTEVKLAEEKFILVSEDDILGIIL